MNKQDIIFQKNCMYDPQSFFIQEKKRSKCDFHLRVQKMCFLFFYIETTYIFLQSFLQYHNFPAPACE